VARRAAQAPYTIRRLSLRLQIVPIARLSDQLYPRMVARRGGYAPVARQQWRVECFRERDIHRVVSGEVVP